MTQISSNPTTATVLVEYQEGAVVSRTILKQEKGNVTLFAFDKGQALSENTAPFEALVQVLEGKAEVAIAGQPHQMQGGEMIILPANQPHAIRAVERFKMLLTTIRLRRSAKVLKRVLFSYLRRWSIEETIRFIKQTYDLENIRVLRYVCLQNMMALVLAVFYFLAAILDTHHKLKVMAGHVLDSATLRSIGPPRWCGPYLLPHAEAGPIRPTTREPCSRSLTWPSC